MSETMNLRPFVNLPETDAIREGDKVLVNQDGIAKQLDASKIGAGTGSRGLTIYVSLEELDSAEIVNANAYADKELTTQMIYDEVKEKAMGGVVICGSLGGITIIITPSQCILNDEIKVMMIVSDGVEKSLVFADSITG